MIQIPLEKIPQKGLMMAYFKEKLVFSSYEVLRGKICFPDQVLLEKEEPYECHFFDKKTEYRMIKRTSRHDVIERILTENEEEAMPKELLFAEDVLVKEEYTGVPGIPKKIRVVNRYRYSENDTLVLQDYRISQI